jgi:hypothetical protein
VGEEPGRDWNEEELVPLWSGWCRIYSLACVARNHYAKTQGQVLASKKEHCVITNSGLTDAIASAITLSRSNLIR